MNSRESILCQQKNGRRSAWRALPLLFALMLAVLTPASLPAQSTTPPAASVAAWSPDSGFLAAGAGDGTVRVLDSQTWRSLVTLRDLDAAVTYLTWSPDGRFLAAGAADGMVQVWDTETWRVVTTLEGVPAAAAPDAAETDAETDAEADAAEDAPAAEPEATAEAPAAAEKATEKAPARVILDVSDFPTVTIEDAAADTDGYYRLQTEWLEGENKCFEGGMPDPARFLGGAAYMEDCQDLSGQLWKFVPNGDGYYQLQTQWLEPDDKCLEGNRLDPERFLAGAAYMDDCEDVSGQLWTFVPADDGYYRLQTQWLEAEDQCLEGNRPGPEWPLDGAAHMTDCDDVTGQFWKIIPAEAPGASSAAPSTQAGAPATQAGELSFEAFGSWRRGDQPYATFAASADPVHGGAAAGKVSYDFTSASADDDFVVFTQRMAVAGEPNRVQAWVHGDGSGHLFNIWIEDDNGEVWSVPMGAVSHSGWEEMTGAIDPNAPWPGGYIYGPKNGAIDYPIRFLGIVIDRTDGSVRGEISLDDIRFGTGDAPVASAQAQAPADPCADIPASTQSDVMIRFVNTSDDPLIVTWVDFDGNLDSSYSTVIGPKDFFDQESFPAHEWAILDLSAQRIDTYVAGDAGTQCATIGQ